MRYIILIILVFSLNSIYSQSNHKIVYEADSEGKVISGDRQTLLDYVQNGNPIRVGWVLRFPSPIPEEKGSVIEMEHWADAGFITVLKGHVFAQISSIYQQGPMIANPPGVLLVDDRANSWVGIIGTTGVMCQKFAESKTMTKMYKDMGYSEEKIKEEYKKQETMKFETKWSVLTTNK